MFIFASVRIQCEGVHSLVVFSSLLAAGILIPVSHISVLSPTLAHSVTMEKASSMRDKCVLLVVRCVQEQLPIICCRFRRRFTKSKPAHQNSTHITWTCTIGTFEAGLLWKRLVEKQWEVTKFLQPSGESREILLNFSVGDEGSRIEQYYSLKKWHVKPSVSPLPIMIDWSILLNGCETVSYKVFTLAPFPAQTICCAWNSAVIIQRFSVLIQR